MPDLPRLKAFADEELILNDKIGRKFSKRVEKTGGKGKMACCKPFLLFPTVFSNDLYRDT